MEMSINLELLKDFKVSNAGTMRSIAMGPTDNRPYVL